MNAIHKKEYLGLLLGDIVVLFVSLVLTLIIRYGQMPTNTLLVQHLEPFSILFVVFILIHFIAGLYEKHTLSFKNKLPLILLNVQIVNAFIGTAFFYLVSGFSVAPKFILFIYLVISLVLMYAWRMLILHRSGSKKTQKALMIADSPEAQELITEINDNSRYNVTFVESITPTSDAQKIVGLIKDQGITLVVVDTGHPALTEIMPVLYSLAISGISFIDASKMYEEVFDCIPLTMVRQGWFIEHMSGTSSQSIYDVAKRLIDIVCSLIGGIISLVVYPFVILAIKLDDGGVIFSYQKRVGQFNKIVNIAKFRTMTVANDNGKWGSVENKVTRVGSFLRKTRIDELPQLWNVLRGDVSLIGPRPEFPEPVKKYSEEITYYNFRHSIKPGLSGWAQIYGEHAHHGIGLEETANKLSYDLYYIKHRSFLLDIKILLRTIKTLITFVGR